MAGESEKGLTCRVAKGLKSSDRVLEMISGQAYAIRAKRVVSLDQGWIT